MSADNWTKCPKCGNDFREDYEIGMCDGDFEVEYFGSCGTSQNQGCGFEFSYKYSEKVSK